jgi:hypothetical protein
MIGWMSFSNSERKLRIAEKHKYTKKSLRYRIESLPGFGTATRTLADEALGRLIS